MCYLRYALLGLLALATVVVLLPADARQDFSALPPQLPLPTKVGEVFVIDDFDNDVTQIDLGSNYFMGNTGAAERAEGITTISWSEESNGSAGGSLWIEFDFAGQLPVGPFAGYFASLFGLTDTKVRLDGEPGEPPDSTPFPGYFLDLLDIYRGSLLWPDRSVEQLEFDIRLLSAEPDQPIDLRIELTEEKDNPLDPDEVPRQVFTRREIAGNEWQPVSLALPNESDSGDFTRGDVASFNPRRVSVLSLVVERFHDADKVDNPDTGSFLVDNIRLVDTDGSYPDLDAIEAEEGGLQEEYTEAFLDLVRATSFLYFLDFASTDERTGGIIQDRSTFADLMSVGGVGFQLTAYVVAAERGYISREDAANRAHSILAVLHGHPQGSGRVGMIGYKGFFYHFLGIDGLRKQNFDFAETEIDESLNTVELSTIDTALALAGVITAGEYFDEDTDAEKEIRSMADEIYGRVDWTFMLEETSNQFYLGWKPNETRDDDSGRFGRFKLDDADGLGQYSSKPVDGEEVPATLDFYTDEGVLIGLLAIASPTHPVDDSVFYSMIREGTPFMKTYPGSLFTYQFGSVWLDTQALGADAHPARPIDYFDNTRSAILATRQYACDNPEARATLNCDRWGLSATEGPFDGYFAEAAPPAAIATAGQCIGSGGAFALEGEDGTGDGEIKDNRGAASGGQTVWLRAGESRTLSFDLDGSALYEVAARYSNDNFGPLETVEVSIDGASVGQFEAQDTGDWGFGWFVFEWSGPVGSIVLAPGPHEVAVLVSGGDGFGVEIDLVALEPMAVERPLEVGTVTIYGVGSSMVHAPDEAIAALWEAQNLTLLHPRFGSADAFNLDIADAAIPACVDPDEPRVLRTDGPWANFNGFGIDHGPMLLMIDSYLEDQFTPNLFMYYPAIREALARVFHTWDSDGDGVPDSEDNCPAWPNADQLLPPWPVPDDDPDCDGFTTTIENWVGTLPDQHCGDATPNNESPQPWPTDNNDNTWSMLDDALRYIPVFNTFAPGPPYDQRFDLNADGGIGLGDVLKYIPVINKSCAP